MEEDFTSRVPFLLAQEVLLYKYQMVVKVYHLSLTCLPGRDTSIDSNNLLAKIEEIKQM